MIDDILTDRYNNIKASDSIYECLDSRIHSFQRTQCHADVVNTILLNLRRHPEYTVVMEISTRISEAARNMKYV